MAAMSAPEPPSDVDDYIRRLGLLHELGQELGRALDEGAFFQITAGFIRRILPQIERATVTLVTPDGAHLDLLALDAKSPSAYAWRSRGPCSGSSSASSGSS
jgi:GAF domain-containing protein